jgi:hypothetical protein
VVFNFVLPVMEIISVISVIFLINLHIIISPSVLDVEITVPYVKIKELTVKETVSVVNQILIFKSIKLAKPSMFGSMLLLFWHM